MSNYTKSTNFATKDNLVSGDPLKIVKGTEIDTEYNNIATAIATKTDNASAAITGGTITGITDLAVADGGTGASTAATALNNLLPSQTSAANKYLQSDGTNASWDAVTLSTADITGTLGVANGGTGVTTSTGTTNVVLSNSPTLVTPALGTPSSATLTNATGLPISTGVSGLGTGVATALSVNTGQNNAVVLFNGALGTPSSGTVTNLTGTASININGTVGVVSPASGSFTTLNTSSTVTITGGTANGIGYLNGSKVFTTGTVLKFDGTNITSDRSIGTVYSGTSFATWTNGIVLNNSATPATGLLNSLYFTNNANMQNVFGVVQNASGYGDFVWAGYSGSYAEAMRLTSAGLAITGTLSASSTATLNTLASSGATLTGGTINGMTIGATTASTGAFTTVAASGAVTLSGGTANGVTYLNGSKVVTSGSALTFDGTNFQVGGNSQPIIRAVSSSTNNATARLFTDGDTAYIGSANTSTSGGSVPVVFQVGGSEQMRLTSTGLGIGTSSPSYKLDVVAASSSAIPARLKGSASGNNNTQLRFAGNNSGTDLWAIGTEVSTSSTSTAFDFYDLTAGANRMRLDSSGNLGLGVTPSAWSFKAFEFGYAGNALWASATNDVRLTANVNYNSGYKYTNTSTATMYAQGGGQHAWYNAASGTAGNAITFTQAMTLDADGDLGIGNTSPAYKLDVTGGLITANLRYATVGTGNTALLRFSVNNNYDGQSLAAIGAYSENLNTTATSLVMQTEAAGGAGLVERARISSDGTFRVKGAGTAGSTDAVQFSGSAPASAMLLDSSGYFYVRTTASQGVSTFGGVVGLYSIATYTPSNAGTYYHASFTEAGTVRGSISSNGTLTTYSTTSDYRLKNNAQPLTNSGAFIDALQPKSWDWENGNGKGIGFIAHEFAEVSPSSVVGKKDDVDANGKPIYQSMQASSAEVIANLVAEIQSLRQRLSAANL